MKHAFAPCLALCLLLLLAGGCAQQAEEDSGAADAGTELLEIMSIRDTAEEAYAVAVAELNAPQGEPIEGEPIEEPDPTQIAEEMKRIEMDREGQYEVFTDQLVTYINDNPDSQEAKAAYADYLAKFVAPAFINELGNYMKAVEVFDEALSLDPENAELQALRDTAADLRFITQERYDTVTKGMTYDEVAAICGVANPKHIIDKVERGKSLVGWFYPTVDRGAAGVYFQDGKVYNMKFDAIKAPEIRKKPAEGEEAEAAE